MNDNGVLKVSEICGIISETSGLSEGDRAYLMAQRQALLMWLDALERRLTIHPRTAQLRKEWREA